MSTPEKPPTVSQATESLQVELDVLMAPIHFQELLELAEEVCLTHTPKYPEYTPPQGEAATISRVGTRALRAALELSNGLTLMNDTEELDITNVESEEKRPILLDTTIRIADRFSTGVDFSILAKAEAFGAQLMKESFLVLGPDAYKKAEEFQNATTKDEQIKILEWLDIRLHTIASKTVNSTEIASEDGSEDNEVQEQPFYHPIRLSPKIIGRYPDIEITPTCLGVSVIAAGFFKQANAEMLHANVSRRGIDQDRAHTIHFIGTLREELGKKFGVSIPDKIQRSIDTISKQLISTLTEVQPHHAAVYVKLIDDSWAQFDSNFVSSVPIQTKTANDSLNTAYDAIKGISTSAPGIEVSSYLHDFLAPAEIMQEIFELQNQSAVTNLMISALVETLDDDPEAFAQRIYDSCIEPFFSSESTDDRLGLMTEIFKTELIYDENQFDTLQIQRAFHQMFEKYVLWGASPNEVVERMSRDKHYRINRVMDITALPFIMMTSAASYAAKSSGWFRPHALVELGLPEQRIGLAVLSDFATHTESPLPASFWTSHWPGFASVIENINGASRSSFEDSLLYNNLVYGTVHPLTSRQNYGIINEFIDSRQPIKENEDGSRQERAGQAHEQGEARRTQQQGDA